MVDSMTVPQCPRMIAGDKVSPGQPAKRLHRPLFTTSGEGDNRGIRAQESVVAGLFRAGAAQVEPPCIL